ncbi:MAG: bifunctional 3,4-dihydroxy-2-butanone-4-phosphate synthase/GTP cyclohydrolase II [Candidatus Omnitrophica bacterium]|nr:bifunctional 3,4-dihydroxy-2-butanone-4-phosphate synthase/GTP cyclohydrolase II [Candidatus Omnitrophota bacterium]
MKFDSVEELVSDIKQGKMVIIIDDEDRENEGDLVIAAEYVKSSDINFMAKHGRGLICVPMEAKRLEELRLQPMLSNNEDPYGTAWMMSVDAKHNVTTGISAHDRAHTIKVLIEPNTKPDDLIKPGHIFPLRAREGGVLIRAGHTEASIDIIRLAGLYPASVICEIMNEDGTMARTPQLIEFAKLHHLKIGTIANLIKYRRKSEKLIIRLTETDLPTPYGRFRLILYESIIDKDYHIALVLNKPKDPTLVRVHSECLTGDVFRSLRCDCGRQLELAMQMLQKEGSGVILYMRQEGRGIGLVNKLKAYALQDKGLDTVQANEVLGFKADLRDYGIGAQILVDLGIKNLRLLTNNPQKIVGIEGYGLSVIERIPLEVMPNEINRDYLKAKKIKLGHELNKIEV